MSQRSLGPDMDLPQPNYWSACSGWFERKFHKNLMDKLLVWSFFGAFKIIFSLDILERRHSITSTELHVIINHIVANYFFSYLFSPNERREIRSIWSHPI